MKTDVIQELLYTKSIQEVIPFLASCNDSDVLHIYAYNYNWNNGFDAPRTIVDNPACSLGTALTIFYLADGYRYLTEKNESSEIPEWLNFISYLYDCIISGIFSNKAISFAVPLTKVQCFKLKKHLTEKEQIFLSNIEGENLDITL